LGSITQIISNYTNLKYPLAARSINFQCFSVSVAKIIAIETQNWSCLK